MGWLKSLLRKAMPQWEADLPIWRMVLSGQRSGQDPIPQFKNYTLEEMQQLYRFQALVYRCVSILASTTTEPPLDEGIQTESGFEKRDGKYDDILYNDQDYTFSELIGGFVSSMQLVGRAYFIKIRVGRKIVKLVPVPSDTVEPIISKKIKRAFSGYKIGTRTYDPSDIIEGRYPDPNDFYDSVGPLHAALRDSQFDDERISYWIEFLRNAPVPKLVVSSEFPLTQEQREELRKSLVDVSARGKRGSPVVMSNGQEIVFNAGLEDQSWPDYTDLVESRVCAAFGVPAIVAGFGVGLRNGTYSNYKSALKAFYRVSMVPLWRKVSEVLTRGLLVSEGDMTGEYRFNLSNVHELREDGYLTAQKGIDLYKAGVITLNEAREMAGLSPMEDGDELGSPQESTSFQSNPDDKNDEYKPEVADDLRKR